MNKRISSLLATSIVLVNLMPITNTFAAENTEPNNDTCYTMDENHHHHHKDKCDDEINMKIIKKNIKCLTDSEKKQYDEICKIYEKEKKLSDENKCNLVKLREAVIKSKLGDDYEEFVKLTNMDNLTDADKTKLEDFMKKIMD